jgi:hypothetical protein
MNWQGLGPSGERRGIGVLVRTTASNLGGRSYGSRPVDGNNNSW